MSVPFPQIAGDTDIASASGEPGVREDSASPVGSQAIPTALPCASPSHAALPRHFQEWRSQFGPCEILMGQPSLGLRRPSPFSSSFVLRHGLELSEVRLLRSGLPAEPQQAPS